MSAPTIADLTAAATTLAACAKAGPNKYGNLQELRSVFEDARQFMFRSQDAALHLTVSGASVAALKTVHDTAKGTATAVGDIFECLSTADAGGGLAAAKGSAPVVGDYFRWTNVGTPAIEFCWAPTASSFAPIDALLAND